MQDEPVPVTRVAFTKVEGLGNDFLVVEGVMPSASDVRRLCDRHFGVGADGILVVGEGKSAGAAASMVVLNADGSRPEMCGNGLRCVARFVAARRDDAGASMIVDTDAGPLGCAVDREGITVAMGVAEDRGVIEVGVFGDTVTLFRVGTGNPHAITFQPYGAGAFERLGPVLATHPAFPEGTNVEMAVLRNDGSIGVRVWERGVGPTLACGTGACATAVRACLDGTRAFDAEIPVDLPGGRLFVTVAKNLAMTMRGPARLVFTGVVDLDGAGPAS